MNLHSIIENHLKPGPWNHQLKQFCEEQLDCLKFFIRKYPKGSRSPFCELDIKAPIRQQLANLVILEYPVIYVFLPSHSFNFEVVKDANPIIRKLDLKDSGSNASPQGVPFKEEEIEDNDSSAGPRICDLMKQMSSDPMHQFPHSNRSSEKATNNSSEGPFLSRVATVCSSHYSSSTNQPGLPEMEFDFDQGLIDAYSDLIAQINPDDFLDLGGDFAEQDDLERTDPLVVRGAFSAEEEVEEGEILE